MDSHFDHFPNQNMYEEQFVKELTFPKEEVEDFFNHILPPLPPQLNVGRVIERLVAKHVLVKDNGDYVWSCLTKNPQAIFNYKGNAQSHPLVEIFDAVTDAAQTTCPKLPNPTLQMMSQRKPGLGPTEQSCSIPEVLLVLRNTKAHVNATSRAVNTAVPISVHKECIRSRIRIFEHMRRILTDPCRRFTFGIDFEMDSEAEKDIFKIWTINRGMIVTSRTIGIRENCETLIKLLICLAFADKEDLGWDPTVRATLRNGVRHFVFKVDSKSFFTNERDILFGDKSEYPFGPGTRIYKAYREDDIDKKEPVVLKDYWPRDDYCTEDILHGVIQYQLEDPECLADFRRHTMSILASGRVETSKGDDHTVSRILRGRSPLDHLEPRLLCPSRQILNDDGDSVLYPSEKDLKQWRESFVPRLHYRIVYREYATPFDQLTNTLDMGDSTLGALKALTAMHSIGWVHRDVSVGNLYLYTDPVSGDKRGLIGDFEFSRPFGLTGLAAGTPGFWAYEVMVQRHVLRQPRRILANKDIKSLSFCHSHVHDLESLWWIQAWSLFSKEQAPPSLDVQAQKAIAEQTHHFDELFPGLDTLPRRVSFFYQTSRFDEYTKCISPAFSRQKKFLSEMRSILIDYYSDKKVSPYSRPTVTDTNSLQYKFANLFSSNRLPSFETSSLEKDVPPVDDIGNEFDTNTRTVVDREESVTNSEPEPEPELGPEPGPGTEYDSDSELEPEPSTVLSPYNGSQARKGKGRAREYEQDSSVPSSSPEKRRAFDENQAPPPTKRQRTDDPYGPNSSRVPEAISTVRIRRQTRIRGGVGNGGGRRA